jgi:hypothetical protein
MSNLIAYLKGNPVSSLLHLSYLIGWTAIYHSVNTPLREGLDACAAGMLTLGPLILGMVASFFYCVTFIVLGVSNQEKGTYYLAIVLTTVIAPVLVLSLS